MVRKQGPFVSFICLVVHGIASVAIASPLSDLANTMEAGEWSSLPTNLSNIHTRDSNISVLTWSDSAAWDPVRREVRAVCKRAGTYNHRVLTYSEASNSWSVDVLPSGYGQTGHCYDGNTADPNTGELYHLRYRGSSVRRFNGSSWSDLPQHGLSLDAAPALAAFPGLSGTSNALFMVMGAKAAWYDGSAWTTINPNGTSWGTYHQFAEYNPVHDVMLFGGGNNGTRIIYQLDSDLTLTQLGDSPITLRMSNSMVSVDPVSGDYIVYSVDNDSWRAYDIVDDQWSTLSMSGAPTIDSKGGLQVPIPVYGVIMYVVSSDNSVWLYKHAPSDGLDTTIPAAPTNLVTDD